jgi:hypothetical protein
MRNFLVFTIKVILAIFVCVSDDDSLSSSDSNPLDSGKEILYFLFYTQDEYFVDDIKTMKFDLELNDKQMSFIAQSGLAQHKFNRDLYDKSSAKTITSDEFNTQINNYANEMNNNLKLILDKKYDSFRDWIMEYWKRLQTDTGNPLIVSTLLGVNTI